MSKSAKCCLLGGDECWSLRTAIDRIEALEKAVTPDCPICGKPMEHDPVNGPGGCAHWYCAECDQWNWPAALEPEDDCPVCGV